jgi:hypothetical protein
MGKVSLSSRRVDCGSIVLIIESSLRGGGGEECLYI